MIEVLKIEKSLKSLENKKQAVILQKFFKTGVGEYGEGDVFLGLMVPSIRRIAKQYSHITFPDIKKLLHSQIHEYRQCALFILVEQYKVSGESLRDKIAGFYFKNTKYINNWDLVDLSAPNILGNYLVDKPKDVLYKMAKSKNLWNRRISIISTFSFIQLTKFSDTLKIAQILLKDGEDLIHKAVGWMLREVGNRSLKDEEKFLQKHYKNMPRTMLRYAIEKFPEVKRQKYLKGSIHTKA